jgi:uncharacterized protein (UPF0332 family)
VASKKLHGERNLKLCEKLLKEKFYYDWVITTAFYSAIHFVEDYALPHEIKGKKCENILDVKNAYNMRGRHAARERLVYEKLSLDIGIKYKWMDDKSRYARYNTYKFQPAEASKAKQYLDEIFNFCYNNK